MSVSVEKLSSNRVKLSFEIDTATFDKAMNSSYRKNVGKIQVPGFRRGKAPRKVIENMYGEAVFFEDALEEIFPPAYEAAIEENNLKPVDQPDVEWGNIGGGEPLTFTLEVYVSPDVTLGEYRGLKATEPKWEVTDEQVQGEIERARERIARWVDADRAVETGDRAVIDYAGSVDGVAFEGGTAERFPLEIGSGSFIPGFEEQIVGMNPGEERDIPVTFPEDYRAEDLKGKDAVFHIKLHEVKRKELPEIDDEFAADVSEFDTFEEYKADVRSKLEEDAKENALAKTNNELVEAAVALSEMDVPEPMIQREVESRMREFTISLLYQGLSMEQFYQATNQTPDDLRAQYREPALMAVKTQLLLEAIREKENIEPTQEKIDAEIARAAKQRGRGVEDYKEGMREQDHEYVERAASIEMVLDILRDSAVYEKAETADNNNEADA